MPSMISGHSKAIRLLIQPLYVFLNIFVLIVAHSITPHTSVAAVSASKPDTLLNETTHVGGKYGEMNDFLPSMVIEFLERMKKNGVDHMNLMDFLFCGCLVLLGLELVSDITLKVSGHFKKEKTIPVRGKHLDELSPVDMVYIALNKIAVVPFVYLFVKFMYYEPNAEWSLSTISLQNTILPLPAIIIIYDFFYTLLHWALHLQAIYGYIHKHHHRQKAPSRGNLDAVNVHPVEFFFGEYNHMFAVYIYTHFLGYHFHVIGLALFMVVAGVLTGLNHTRYDSSVVLFGKTIYDSKWHDVHHRIPQSNYGQYINFWDLIFGSFRPYNSEDRVNPLAQLDPKTLKSYEYGKKNLVKND